MLQPTSHSYNLRSRRKFKMLKDGLLDTGNQTIKAVTTEYALVVPLAELQYPSFLRGDVVKLTDLLK